MQLALLNDDHIKKSIITVPIDQLKISEYNPRKDRKKDDVTRLAERISRNGFEITRALWAERNGDGYEVFAGGTRLEAARLALLPEVPIVLHEGLTEDDKVRLAHEDNENDEYHERLPDVQEWANYAWLSDKGWTQKRIGEAMGVHQQLVGERISLNKLPNTIKKFTTQGKLTEGHLREINKIQLELYFEDWLTTETAMLEQCKNVLKTKGGKSVKATREDIKKFKAVIQAAEDFYTELAKLEGEAGFELETSLQDGFLKFLADTEARTAADVNSAYSKEQKRYTESLNKYQLELAKKQGEAEAEALKAEQETQKNAEMQAILDNLIYGDFDQVCDDLEDGSIDAIITDPPYPKEFLLVYETLAIQAARLLKPGGSLLVMCGQSYIPEILNLMTPHIDYFWMLSYQTPGGQSPQIWNRKVNTFWKPILWFVKGEYQGEWHGDVIKSDVNDNDKKHHHWGQSESGMMCIVEKFTEPDQTILDPFLGGGTTGMIALSLGRKFIGIDKDKESIDTSKDRIYNMLRGGNNG